MEWESTGKGSFLVKILHTQNATWQGTVTWLDGRRTESFRSALELMKLMDGALIGSADPEPPAGA